MSSFLVNVLARRASSRCFSQVGHSGQSSRSVRRVLRLGRFPQTTISVMNAPGGHQDQARFCRHCNFSTNSAAAVQEDQQEPMTFKSEKVQDLFQRITTTCSKEDVARLATIINDDILGMPLRKNEFYYRGFGGRGGGASAAASGQDGAAESAAAEAKTTVDLKLTGFDAKAKIKVIKEVRSIASLGLKEAKELVEGAPATIQKDLKPEQAEELKAKLEAVGATIEVV